MTQLPQESIKMNCTSAYVSDFFSSSRVPSTRIWCNRWVKFNSQADDFSSLTRLTRAMTDYDDRSNCASNMYLPYYVSAPDFSSVSSFLPQTTSCQVNFPYSSNLAQVQPVREVTFRDYGLDHPSKWHYRGNYASYYSTEEIMHRDLLQSSNRADMIFKNDPMYSHHGGTNSSCNFFTNAGRNGVLPQGFDQFFETVNSEKLNLSSPNKSQIRVSPEMLHAVCLRRARSRPNETLRKPWRRNPQYQPAMKKRTTQVGPRL